METIPKLFWKRLERMNLNEFEVPQWNISVNDSGIQVTLFWAEKVASDEVPSADSLVNTVAESILAEYDKSGQTAVERKSPEKITELEKSKIEDQSWKSNSSSFKLIQTIDPPAQKTPILPKLDLYSRSSGLTNGGLSSLINGNGLIKPKTNNLFDSTESKKRKFESSASLVTPPTSSKSMSGKSKKSATCDICGSTFTYRQNMLRHRKTHDPKDNFKCEVCGKTFARNENLQKHIQANCDGLTSGLANTNLTVLDLSSLMKTESDTSETVVEEVDHGDDNFYIQPTEAKG